VRLIRTNHYQPKTKQTKRESELKLTLDEGYKVIKGLHSWILQEKITVALGKDKGKESWKTIDTFKNQSDLMEGLFEKNIVVKTFLSNQELLKLDLLKHRPWQM
jgi:hypothetical protein